MDGWPGEEHPHTAVVTGGREPGPGWTDEQIAVVARLRAECTDQAVTITAHPFWGQFEGESAVAARMELKAVTRPTMEPTVDVVAAA